MRQQHPCRQKAQNNIACKSIPFVGRQPVGELRWKATADVFPDDGVCEACCFGRIPCQAGSVGRMGFLCPRGEDCTNALLEALGCKTVADLMDSDLMQGCTGAWTPFPWDIREVFGKGRIRVHATFDGIPYDGSIVNMGVKNPDGSVCYYSPRRWRLGVRRPPDPWAQRQGCLLPAV